MGAEQARRQGLLEMEIVMLHNAGDDHLFMGNMREAYYYFNESLRRSRAARFDRLTEANEMFTGFIEAAHFGAPAGLAALRTAIDTSRSRGRLWNLTQGHQLLGRALLALGDVEGSVAQLSEAVRVGEQSGIRFFTDQARKWLVCAQNAANRHG